MFYLLGWGISYYCFALISILGSRWRVLAALTVTVLGCLAIFRGAVGTDTVDIYEFMAAHISVYSVEPGFWLLMYLSVSIFDSPIIAVRAVAVVFTLLLLFFVIKADKDELFYLMAFFIPTFFYSHSMNGLRIGMAFLVLLLALQYFRRSKQRTALILCAIAISFHYSSVVVLVFLWLSEVNLKSKRNLLLAAAAVPVALGVAIFEYDYFYRKFVLYIESGYTSPSALSGLSEVAVAGVIALALPFSRLPRASRIRTIALTLVFMMAFLVFSRFSYAGLRLLELLTFALPFTLMYLYQKHQINLDSRVKGALVVAGVLGMLSLYRNMVLEAQTIPDAQSPFLPYRTLFEE